MVTTESTDMTLPVALVGEPIEQRIKVALMPFRRRLLRYAIIAGVIVACMLGVALISKYVLIDGGIQLDEAQTLWQADHSLAGVLHVVALDVHVPLYHLIVHFWELYFGTSIRSVRIISNIFFLATIPLFYLLARSVLSTRWSLFATILFSFSPFMDWYANVARMYTMLAFFATLSQLLVIRLLRNHKGWAAYGVSSVIGAYSHYFFSFNLIAEGLYIMMNRRKIGAHSVKRLIIVAIAVIVALAPWLLYFYALGAGSNTRPLLQRPTTIDFFNVYSQFLFGFQDNHVNTIIVSCWPVVMLIGFLAVRRGQRVTPEVKFMATMAFVPVLMAFVLSFIVTPFFLSRYLISSVAPLFIFLVWLISYYEKQLVRICGIVLISGFALSSYLQANAQDSPVQEPYQKAVRYINAHATARDAVVISTPFTIYPVEYYYHSPAAITTLPEWSRRGVSGIPAFSARTLPAQVAAINTHHQNVYLLLSYNQGYENTIQQYYLHHFKMIYTEKYASDMTLFVYKVGYQKIAPLGSPATQLSATGL